MRALEGDPPALVSLVTKPRPREIFEDLRDGQGLGAQDLAQQLVGDGQVLDCAWKITIGKAQPAEQRAGVC